MFLMVRYLNGIKFMIGEWSGFLMFHLKNEHFIQFLNGSTNHVVNSLDPFIYKYIFIQ